MWNQNRSTLFKTTRLTTNNTLYTLYKYVLLYPTRRKAPIGKPEGALVNNSAKMFFRTKTNNCGANPPTTFTVTYAPLLAAVSLLLWTCGCFDCTFVISITSMLEIRNGLNIIIYIVDSRLSNKHIHFL